MSQPPTRLPRRLLRTGMMIATLLVAGACVRAASTPTAPDPLHTDGDKYHLVLDNQFVRVLRYHDEPGAMTHLHYHPCFVMYALGPFKRELGFADGSRRTREFHEGQAIWMPAQSHTGHNVGATPTEALLVEFKGPCG